MKKLSSVFNENKGRAFGLIYPYILGLIVLLGLYFIGNLDNVARQKVPAVIPDTTRTEGPKLLEARTVPPVDVKEVSVPTNELIDKGKTLYQANCSSCHGDEGAGAGPAAVGLNPAPRNFTVKDNWKNGAKLSGIYTTLEEGIAGSSMIAYDFLTPEERFALAHYIRNAFVPDPPSDSPDELAALDQLYRLSEGQELPAQIPVDAAQSLLINENKAKAEKLAQILEMISKDKSGEGSELFNFVILDKKKALSALLSKSDWHQNQQVFVKYVSENVNANGFSGRIFNLSESEWSALYNYLSKMM